MGTLLNRRRYIGGGGAPLPYDAEIEYLEGTGTQWLDTGVSISNGIFAEYYGAFGSASPIVSTDTTNVGQLFRVQINGYNISPWKGSIGKYIRISPAQNVFYNIGHDTRNLSHKLYWNGEIILDEDTSSTLTNPYSICVFHNYGSVTKGKIRTLKLTDNNGDMVLDWKAVRVGQVGYMYDNITGTFHGNDGEDSFILGNDL